MFQPWFCFSPDRNEVRRSTAKFRKVRPCSRIHIRQLDDQDTVIQGRRLVSFNLNVGVVRSDIQDMMDLFRQLSIPAIPCDALNRRMKCYHCIESPASPGMRTARQWWLRIGIGIGCHRLGSRRHGHNGRTPVTLRRSQNLNIRDASFPSLYVPHGQACLTTETLDDSTVIDKLCLTLLDTGLWSSFCPSSGIS